VSDPPVPAATRGHGRRVVDEAVKLIVWAVRRALLLDDPTELDEGPPWLALRLAGCALAADVVTLAHREAVRALDADDELAADYAAALALAAGFADDCRRALLRRTAVA
jgi:hypothetical protein